MKIKEILNFLIKSDIDFEFIGNQNHNIDSPLTYFETMDTFSYSMSNHSIDFKIGLMIVKDKEFSTAQNIIVTKNAKYVFYHIVSQMFSQVNYDNPIITSNSSMEVGYNSVIHNNVEYGKDIIIYDSTVIGRPGFSYYDLGGTKLRLNPYGKVIIKDGCNISSNCNIDRGNVGDTIIHENVVVDSLVHIAHDVSIGENTIVTAGVVFSGYVTIGSNCFVGVNSSFRNGVSIGNNVTVGMGSNVTKSFGDNLVLAGNPAKIFGVKCECGKTGKIVGKTFECNCGLKYSISPNQAIKKEF